VAESANLFAQQEANRRKSRRVIFLFVLFFAWLGFGGDLIWYLATKHAPPGHTHVFPFVGLAMIALAAGMTGWAWLIGPSAVLWSTGARKLDTPSTPEEKQLVNVVEEMAIASGLPKPAVYVIDDPDPNAFATGHDPATASLAVTTGLMGLCSRDELQAVVAHEMGHIKNLDVRLMTLLAALVGVVALVANGAWRFMPWGVSGRDRDEEGSSGNGALVAVLFVVWIVSWMLAPLITRLLALAVSRDREYLADASGAQFTRNPSALASALEKIDHADIPSSVIKGGAAHLCIADPLGRSVSNKEGKLADLLATHPPMAIRIARLKAMAYRASTGKDAALTA
jgi:heat shock protein HtpX